MRGRVIHTGGTVGRFARAGVRLAAAVAAAAALLATTTPTPAAPAAPTPAPTWKQAPPVPAGFHWGVSTSGFQSEGYAPDSNWSRHASTRLLVSDPYRDAVDFRHRYRDDIALAASMGVNTFRFSVEWARLEPHPGEVDEAELAYYDDVVATVRAAGMTPMITLDHWVYPGWVVDRGGWANPDAGAWWLEHARRVVSRYAGQGVLWITFNEPTYYVLIDAIHGLKSYSQVQAMRAALADTHRKAYDLIHDLDPAALVTSNLAYTPPPLPDGDDAFMDQVRDKLDYLGIDYYWALSLDNLTGLASVAGQFTIRPSPDGIYDALVTYSRRFPGLPLFVVENGMATDDGAPRPYDYTRADYIRDHVYWIQRAMADDVPVIGYSYWSLFDNYEWGSYRSRFGLYRVDVLADPTLERKETDGVAAYREVIASGGVSPGFAPRMRPMFCSFANLAGTCTPARLLGLPS